MPSLQIFPRKLISTTQKSMNSTSNSNTDNNLSEESRGYVYYSVGLSCGVLLVIILLTLASYCCGRCRNLQNRPRSESSNTSTSTTMMEQDSSLTIQVHLEEIILNNSPVLLYSQAKLHNKPDAATSCCSICLADYQDTDWLRLLPDCGHLFHKDCIGMWFKLNLTCPVCRTSPIPTPLSTPLAEVTPLATRRQ